MMIKLCYRDLFLFHIFSKSFHTNYICLKNIKLFFPIVMLRVGSLETECLLCYAALNLYFQFVYVALNHIKMWSNKSYVSFVLIQSYICA